MKHTNTRKLHRYWETLRAGRSAPYRSEVDPRAIAELLESTFILERISENTTRYRLAGTRLCENFGMELRGMSALALWHGECRARMRSVVNQVVSEPCVGHVTCTVETRGGRFYDAEFIYLPMRSDMGEMNRILGCGYYMNAEAGVASTDEPVRHWVESTTLTPIRLGRGEETPDVPTTTLPKKSAVELLNDRLRDGRARRAPKLRSIEGGAPLKAAEALRMNVASERKADRSHLRLIKTTD